MTTEKKDFQTLDGCQKILERRASGNRWVIGLVVASVFLVVRFCMAHVETDNKQGVAIGRLEIQMERLAIIDAKIDTLIKEARTIPARKP